MVFAANVNYNLKTLNFKQTPRNISKGKKIQVFRLQKENKILTIKYLLKYALLAKNVFTYKDNLPGILTSQFASDEFFSLNFVFYDRKFFVM